MGDPRQDITDARTGEARTLASAGGENWSEKYYRECRILRKENARLLEREKLLRAAIKLLLEFSFEEEVEVKDYGTGR